MLLVIIDSDIFRNTNVQNKQALKNRNNKTNKWTDISSDEDSGGGGGF